MQSSKKEGRKYQYPPTPKHRVVDELHGEKVADDYRWLEDETDSKVQEWVESQNEYTQAWFSDLPVEDIYEELKQDVDSLMKSVPFIRDSHYFWYERKPGQDQSVLYRAKTLDSEKEVVFNPNTLSDDASITLSLFAISESGRYGVYGVQDSGDERKTVYIRDLETGEEEKFYYGRMFNMTWCDDEKGFYYSISNYEEHGGDIADETHYQQLYYHRLGRSRSEDKLIFDVMDYLPKDAGIGMNVSEDSRYVAVKASVGWREKHCFVIDTDNDDTHKLDIPFETKTGLRILDGHVYAATDHEANFKRVLRTSLQDLNKPIDEWEEFIPEQPDYLIERWGVTKSQIVVNYFHNVVSKPARFDRHTGKYLGTLELPEIADLSALSVNEDYEEFFYALSTFLTPGTHYRFNPENGKAELHWQDERSIDESHYGARQEWYESKDGTQVPMFIVGPKKQKENGNNPVMLTGYGGYGFYEHPGFIGGLKPWLERGGYYALTNIRGGGEFGDAWHKGGIRENKQTSFDDFMAAAEHCISSGLTKPERLIIRGASNGGILMGAVMTQRPELFGAVVCYVPILDMYRYHKFLDAYRWTREWGNPDNKEEFEWLKGYSPYHHVNENQKYPPILLTTAINDSRVPPMHAWKTAAKLQNSHPENLVLLKTEMKAGHGPGKGFYQALHDQAEILCFMMYNTDILQTS